MLRVHHVLPRLIIVHHGYRGMKDSDNQLQKWWDTPTEKRPFLLQIAPGHRSGCSISHFVTAATQNFYVVLPTKKCLVRFSSLAVNHCHPFFSLSFAGLPPTFSFSLSFSCSIFQIFGHDNLSKFNTLDNTDTETISAFRFRLYWLFVVSVLQDAGGYAISRQNNLELHLVCHTCWLSYFALVFLCCGPAVSRAGGLRSRDYQIFSDG